MIITKRDRICMAFLCAAMLVLMGIPALSVHVSVAVDEMGTMSNAALLSGRNWSSGVISAGGYYYKQGMAFVWVLPFLLFKDSLVIYRAASLINALLMSATPAIAYYICRRYLKIEKETLAAGIAAASTMICDVMFQAVYLRGDVMLITLNWVCALMLLNTLYADTKRKSICYSILLSFFAVYAFSCHSRGIVTVLAVVLTVFAIQFFSKKKQIRYLPFLGSMAAFLVADKILQRLFRSAIWGTRAAHATGIPKKSIELLFSVTGIKSYLKMASGWLVNSFTPTAGLVCVGFIACVIILVHFLKKSGKVTTEESVLAMFGGLSYAGSFVLGTVFFLASVNRNFTGKFSERADRIIYDRYICCAFGILCLLALYVLVRRRELFGARAKAVTVGIYGGVLAGFALVTAPWLNNQSFVRKYTGILTMLVKTKKGNVTFRGANVSEGVILMGIVMFAVFLLLLFLSWKKKTWQVCTVAAAISILLFARNISHITLGEDAKRMRRIGNALEIVESLGELHEEYPVIWIDDSGAQEKSYQVCLMDYHIMSRKYQSYDLVDNALVIASELPERSEAEEGAYYLFDDVRYSARRHKKDFVYVKGEKLKEKLESMGISLSNYEG